MTLLHVNELLVSVAGLSLSYYIIWNGTRHQKANIDWALISQRLSSGVQGIDKSLWATFVSKFYSRFQTSRSRRQVNFKYISMVKTSVQCSLMSTRISCSSSSTISYTLVIILSPLCFPGEATVKKWTSVNYKSPVVSKSRLNTILLVLSTAGFRVVRVWIYWRACVKTKRKLWISKMFNRIFRCIIKPMW